MRSSYAWTLENYGKPCTPDLVRVEWYPGQTDGMLAVHAPLYRALGAVFAAHGYKVRDADTGFYNCRMITGGTRPSPHSWPIAGDINWKTNPYVKTPTGRPIRWGVETDMPAAMVAEAKLITASGIPAFRWGGDWRTVKDAMHWEVRVSPEEIAGGVYAPRGFYGSEDDLAYLSDEAQRFWQEVFESLGSPPPAATTPLADGSNVDVLKVLVEDYRDRKASGQAGTHRHAFSGETGDNQ